MSYVQIPVAGGSSSPAAPVAVSGTTIDWSLSDTFYKSISGNTTFSITNSGTNRNEISMLVIDSGTHTVGFGTVTWLTPDNLQPAQKSGGGTMYLFKFINGTIYGTAT